MGYQRRVHGEYSQSQSSERADRIWMVVASATETFTQKN